MRHGGRGMVIGCVVGLLTAGATAQALASPAPAPSAEVKSAAAAAPAPATQPAVVERMAPRTLGSVASTEAAGYYTAGLVRQVPFAAPAALDPGGTAAATSAGFDQAIVRSYREVPVLPALDSAQTTVSVDVSAASVAGLQPSGFPIALFRIDDRATTVVDRSSPVAAVGNDVRAVDFHRVVEKLGPPAPGR